MNDSKKEVQLFNKKNNETEEQTGTFLLSIEVKKYMSEHHPEKLQDTEFITARQIWLSQFTAML